MEQFAKPGEICPNPACPLNGKLQASQAKVHIIKAGKTVSSKYFVATNGTIFYRRRTSEEEILETLALLVGGNQISSLTDVKAHYQRT